MIFEIFVAIFAPPLLYVLSTYLYHLWELRKYPAGPFPLPVIGNLHQLGKKPYESLAELSNIYGDVFGISFGMTRAVIVNTIEPTREALITKGAQFAGKPQTIYTLEFLSRGYLSIAFAIYGPVWSTLRRFSHTSFKMYGDNVDQLMNITIKENEDLHKRLKTLKGKPIEVKNDLGLSILNIVCGAVFGRRYAREDSEFKDIVDYVLSVDKGLASSFIFLSFPWLRFFPNPAFNKIKRGMEIRDPLLKSKLAEHRSSFDGENVRDLTDALLKVTSAEEKSSFTEDHLEIIMHDVFATWYAAVLTTMEWLILYMLHWPQYQEEIYQEIIQHVGTGRYPDLNDCPSLPMIQACIHETWRFSSLHPLGLPHTSTQQSSIGGKDIPKDTVIVFNVWKINQDGNHWKNPEKFDPTRWLDEEGKFNAGQHTSFITFSAGRRKCLGESFAKNQLFVFCSRLFRNFKLEKVPDVPLPSLEGELNVTLTPVPYKVMFTPRENNLI